MSEQPTAKHIASDDHSTPPATPAAHDAGEKFGTKPMTGLVMVTVDDAGACTGDACTIPLPVEED